MGAITGVDDFSVPVVKYFSLSQNFPNPFNPKSKIKYQIAKRCLVDLRIFDMLGREVLKAVSEEQPAGNYEIELDARKLSSGIYFYRLTAGNFSETKKMVILK